MDRRTKRGLGLAGLLFGAAILTELRKQPDDRTWHGSLAGVVPYDLRPPSLARLRSTFWDPDNPQILVPHAFGVGWSINLASVVSHLRAARTKPNASS